MKTQLKTIVERYGYESDNRFIGRCKRTFKRPLVLGECSEIHCVCLLVSWLAPLAQYLPFLVNRIDSFFLQVAIILIAGGKVPYKRHFTKEQRRNDVYCLGLLVRCLVVPSRPAVS